MCKSDYCEWVAGIGGLQKCHKFDDISLQKYGQLITYSLSCSSSAVLLGSGQNVKKSLVESRALGAKSSRAHTFFGKGRLRKRS